jgi:hypothetical protein
MSEVKNTFVAGSMNKDLDDRLVPQGYYRDAQNINVDTSEGGSIGAAQNSLGNTITTDIATISGRLATGARTIGSVTYEAGGLIYWCVAGDFFDGIYEYNEETQTSVRVLQSNKANANTPSKLNFNKNYPITGINFVLGPDNNSFLYITDDYNPPRRINIKRAKSYNIDDDMIDIDIDVALNPPLYAPYIKLVSDPTTESDSMERKFLYFSYRWKYEDNQYSSIAPFSAVAFDPSNYLFDYGVGNNKSMLNKYNSVEIEFETGNQLVKEIQLIVRDSSGINVGIIETYSKDSIGISDNTSYKVVFNNNKIYASLPTDQVTRLFDNVPLLAKAQDIVGNRLTYGNYTQFRNITNSNGDEIKIDFTLNLVSESVTVSEPKQTWKSGRDYEAGLVYLDEKGRMTTVLTSIDNTLSIPLSNANSANTIKLKINSAPPSWATHYRIFIKQSKRGYYNVFPVLYYAYGTYRYFLINQSDVDKFKTGDYITFKNDGSGPATTFKKYKILAAENRVSDFIGANGITELAGFYIKIKVDSQFEFPIGAQSVYYKSEENQANDDFYSDTIKNSTQLAEPAIHYGTGDPNAMTLANNFYSGSNDYRVYIEIQSQTTFKYTLDRTLTGSWVENNPITSGTISVSFLDATFWIQFDTSSSLTIGDRWVVNLRINVGGISNYNNYYGGLGVVGLNNQGFQRAGSIVTSEWVDQSTGDKAIQTGALINITCEEDSGGQPYTTTQSFTSDATYINIEEWFNESGAWQNFRSDNTQGTNVYSQSVNFRRGVYMVDVVSGTGPFAGWTYKYIDQAGGGFNGSNNDLTTTLNSPVHMIIMGYGSNDTNDSHKIRYRLEIYQTDEQIAFETIPSESSDEIFHELHETYPIENGNHLVMWDYDDYQFAAGNKTRLTQLNKRRPHYYNVGDEISVVSDNTLLMPSGNYTIFAIEDRYSVILDFAFPTSGPVTGGKIKYQISDEQDQTSSFTPAIIEINKPYSDNSDFNAWTFGNGLESDRIYDDFNQSTLDFSVRASSTIDNYKQVRSDASLCHSEIYNENSQYNRLNEFNLSNANFKYLDREFGSIQKLFARDTDLIVLQENKISKVLYGKNILSDSIGGGQVSSVKEVFGTQIAFSGEWGISRNPESFSTWGTDSFFTDARRGVVLQLSGDSVSEISSFGMSDYFRDIMKDNPLTQKIGAYDPHNHKYILGFNDQRGVPCNLSISRNLLKVPSNSLGYNLFSINSDSPWTITLQDEGFGTNWVDDFPSSGFGSQVINGSVSTNTTFSNRRVTFVIAYCDGMTETFILEQSKGRKGKIILAVFNKQDR